VCPVPFIAALLLAAAPLAGQDTIQLTDATAQTGVTFRHTDGGSGHRYIVESVVAGLALFDYDGDGLVDIYFVNGAPLRGTTVDVPPRNALYRNNGDWTFTDVTEAAGVGDTGYGLGATAADYDNDGDQDLYVSNFGPNVLYRNDGDGRFTDVTDRAGVGRGDKVGAGTCFLDIEGDGDLDLYAANYVDFNYDNHIVRMIGPYQFHPGPADYNPVADNLFRNDGDGRFTDISAQSGIASVAGTGMGMVCFDYDDDGDTDIFVCNDARANFLFRSDGKGQFEEVALLAGVAYDGRGVENSSMGVDCGDYDNDGLVDLFMTDYSAEMPVLYHNLGNGLFEDGTAAARIGGSAFPHVKWGTGLVDFDNDGDRDLFIACGHFMDNIRFIDDRTDVRVPNVLFRNDGKGTFSDISADCGSGLKPVEASKGAAFDDLDNDGDIDAVVLNANSLPTLLRNDSPTRNRWLELRLQGRQANRDGVGARVRVVAGDSAQVAEVHSGRSYQSHYGTRLHFGLAGAGRVDRVEVRWPGGRTETFGPVAADRLVVLEEGAGDPLR
ncbi:MAG: CRTAC1 family protein, partial [Thermoguttaceae bacterium]